METALFAWNRKQLKSAGFWFLSLYYGCLVSFSSRAAAGDEIIGLRGLVHQDHAWTSAEFRGSLYFEVHGKDLVAQANQSARYFPKF
eukprot:COSAG05_NODE_615_length_8327_cov_6.112543_8_plen_87_part_00